MSQTVRQRKLEKSNHDHNNSDSSSEKKDNSLARNVDIINSADAAYENKKLHELGIQGNRTAVKKQNVSAPRPRKWKKTKELALNLLALAMFVLTFISCHYSVYRVQQYIKQQKNESPSLSDLFLRINEESWKKESGRFCRETIEKVEGIIKNGKLLVDKPTRTQAISFINDNRQISAILVHYAIILTKFNQTTTGTRDEVFEDEIFDNLSSAKLSLESISNLDHCSERLQCAVQLWRAITSKLVRPYVHMHNKGIFRQAWDRVCQALTYSQLSLWKDATEKSVEAITMIESTYENQASNYEVYSWACYICYVAIEKDGKSPSQEFETRCLTAATSIDTAQDKRSDVESMKIFKHLFPYKLLEAKKKLDPEFPYSKTLQGDQKASNNGALTLPKTFEFIFFWMVLLLTAMA